MGYSDQFTSLLTLLASGEKIIRILSFMPFYSHCNYTKDQKMFSFLTSFIWKIIWTNMDYCNLSMKILVESLVPAENISDMYDQ